MDKNSITGIVLIMAMLLGYQYFFAPKEDAIQPKTKTVAIATKNSAAKPTLDTLPAITKDSAIKEQIFTLENKDVKIELSSLGGKISRVELKNYKSYKTYTTNGKDAIRLFDSKKDVFSVEIPTGSSKIALNNLVFAGNQTGQQVNFTSILPNGKRINLSYSLPEAGFQLNYGIDAKEIADQITGSDYLIHWKENVTQSEKDANEERKATINYLLTEDEEFDYLSENPSSQQSESLTNSTDWISFKKKYFLTGLIPQGSHFTKATLTSTPNLNDSTYIKTLDAQITGSTQDLIQGKSNFQFYFGPNDYSIVKTVAPSFGKNVKLSYDFLLPITRYIFVPLFAFLESIFSNYGLLIIVLVLIIKTALLPLTYKSYVSMAKTRILAPEIAAIKEKSVTILRRSNKKP